MTIDKFENSRIQLTNIILEEVKNLRPNQTTAERDHITNELNKLKYCFDNFKPTLLRSKEDFSALSEEDLSYVREIKNFEDLTDRVNSTLENVSVEEGKYFAIAKLLNKVIYFQYKLNILSEEDEGEMSLQQNKFVTGYLGLIDMTYELSIKILNQKIYKQIGNFGNPTLR